MPDFVTTHIDPFTGEDDSADIDAETGTILSRIAAARRCRSRTLAGDVAEAPLSRNAPCPCGSGRKYKHCHGAL